MSWLGSHRETAIRARAATAFGYALGDALGYASEHAFETAPNVSFRLIQPGANEGSNTGDACPCKYPAEDGDWSNEGAVELRVAASGGVAALLSSTMALCSLRSAPHSSAVRPIGWSPSMRDIGVLSVGEGVAGAATEMDITSRVTFLHIARRTAERRWCTHVWMYVWVCVRGMYVDSK